MSDLVKRFIKDVIVAVILAALVLVVIRPTIVKQTSMQSTMYENDYIIMYKLAYHSHGPERGDIIIFQSNLEDETGKKKLLIKRVIGLPGDVMTIENDKVYINGELYEEDYTRDVITPGDIHDLTVPEGQYFVMGDNRVSSVDSRSEEVGMVSRESIKGKAVLRLFPINRIRTF